MELNKILAAILIGVLHLVLAGMLIDDIAQRKRILGGRKAPWVVIVLFVPYIGALLYLLCHPRIFYDGDGE